MSLHSIVEPAGTLSTGWKLVPRDPQKADIRNRDDAAPAPEGEGDRTPSAPDPRSRWEVGEVG